MQKNVYGKPSFSRAGKVWNYFGDVQNACAAIAADRHDLEVVCWDEYGIHTIDSSDFLKIQKDEWPVPPNSIKNTSLVLKAIDHNYQSYGGFQYPTTVGSVVIAPDWVPKPGCGNGLHGWLWGQGAAAAVWDDVIFKHPDTKWLVLEVETDTIIDLGGKVKFPSAKILFIGDKTAATNYLMREMTTTYNMKLFNQTDIIGSHSSNEYYGMAGAYGNADAVGVAVSRGAGSVSFSQFGIAVSRGAGSISSSRHGVAISEGGLAKTVAGVAISTADSTIYDGMAQAKEGGIAISLSSTPSPVSAGEGGVLICKCPCINTDTDRDYTIKVGYIGTDGLKPNTPYVFNQYKNNWMEVDCVPVVVTNYIPEAD